MPWRRSLQRSPRYESGELINVANSKRPWPAIIAKRASLLDAEVGASPFESIDVRVAATRLSPPRPSDTKLGATFAWSPNVSVCVSNSRSRRSACVASLAEPTRSARGSLRTLSSCYRAKKFLARCRFRRR